jgi:hypothetical protein
MRTVMVLALAYLSMALRVFAADGEHELVLPGHEAPRVIRYAVMNGRAILEGDIDLGRVEELETRRRVGEVVSSNGEETVSGIGVKRQPLVVQSGGRWRPGPGGGRIYLDYLWPGGVVPYTIDRSVNENSVLRQHVIAAIQDWNRTNVRFVARNGERDYVRFVVDNSIVGRGQSSVGRQGYRQDIKLRANADSGVIVHEMGHAIGAWHEQSRMDRDEFVRVLWENIRDDAKHNFDKHNDGVTVTAYDFLSVMHYSRGTFGKTNPATGASLDTLESLVSGQAITPGDVLSARDVQGVNETYRPNDCGRVPVLFEHVDRRGARLSLEFSRFDLANVRSGSLADRGSAICVPAGWTVQLLEDDNYRGRSLNLSGPMTIEDLHRGAPDGSDWGDVISSVRVSGVQANPAPAECAGEPIVYEHELYAGRRSRGTAANLHSLGLGDKISSLCVPAGWILEAWEHVDFRGEYLQISGPVEISDLKRESPDGDDWGDKFSSIRVIPPGTVQLPSSCAMAPTLFEHDNFRGLQFALSGDARDLHQHGFGDRASSICVPDGWEVRLHRDSGFSGEELTLRGPTSIADLKRDRPQDEDWGDTISAARVTRQTGQPPFACVEPALFEHDRYRGERYDIKRDYGDLHGFRRGDKASSACVPAGWELTVFEHTDYGGRRLTLRGNILVEDLQRSAPDGWNWGDKISSVRVTQRPPGTDPGVPCSVPLGYHDDHYRGRRIELETSDDLHSQGNGDKLSSVCVPAGRTVILFEHTDRRGRQLQIVGPREILDLKREPLDNTNWGDQASSVQVL